MLGESVIALRDALKKDSRPFKLFFDNNQIVNSLTDVITWNDELQMVHVIRPTAEPAFQKQREIEAISFGYEDIRSISYFIPVDETASTMTAINGIGGKEFDSERAAKIQKYYSNVLSDQNESKY